MSADNFHLKSLVGIVQDVLDQLFILRKINQWKEKPSNINPTYRTPEEKFSNENDFSEEPPSNLELFLKKFDLIETVFGVLLEELTSKGSYESFRDIVEIFHAEKRDEEELVKENSRRECLVKELEKKLESEGSACNEKIESCMKDIGKLKDEIEDFKVESDMKTRYVASWQNSKMEIQELRLLEENERGMREMEEMSTNINREERVHQEIVYLHNELEKDLNEVIEAWKIKYKVDLVEINQRIDIIKDQHEQISEYMDKLQNLYLSREREIEGYKEYKKTQELIRLYKEKQNQAATKIEAWWRGVMVRKGFGKFKKKKEKKLKRKGSEKALVK